MTVVYSLYMCYSVHVLSLHDCVLFIIHVLVYMCSVSMTVVYSLYMCYSVHVLSQCVLFTCSTVYMCSVSMTVFYSLYMCYSVHVLSLHDCGLFIIHVLVYMCSVSMTVVYSLYMCYSVHVLQCACVQPPWLCFIHCV